MDQLPGDQVRPGNPFREEGAASRPEEPLRDRSEANRTDGHWNDLVIKREPGTSTDRRRERRR
jgi:hypothetical protein